MKFSVQK